jgi:hypothetical protein
VIAYDVLTRIADGFDIPRGYVGLSYDDETRSLIAGLAAEDESMTERAEVRLLLSRAAEVTIGMGDPGIADHWRAVSDPATPTPHCVGAADVAQIESVTGGLRALDYQYGGDACRDAVIAQTQLGWPAAHRAGR